MQIMKTYLSLTKLLYVIEIKDYQRIDEALQTKCMKGVITSLYNPVVSSLFTHFPPGSSPPCTHFAVQVIRTKLFQLQRTFHKVIERVSKRSINELISIVMGPLPFKPLEFYEAIKRKERGNSRG